MRNINVHSVRSMLDAPSFVHVAERDDDPRYVMTPERRPLSIVVAGFFRRIANAFRGEDSS